ncbi:MAG: chromosome segregation protein SMC, partial [Bacillota bacterium]|nr:chromosome segregation protein SMC [Bacillota bacterium]
KEGYSIIGQGKIEAILSGKPEDRRNLLEEASGIVKYKTRKEEAEKKLINTEQNLIRIEDILSTYEERLEPLRLENEKAKEFLKFSESLKEKEISNILYFIDKLQDKINVLEEDSKIVSLEINNLKQNKTKFSEDLNNCNNIFEKFEAETGRMKQEYYDNKEQYQNLTSEINLLNERNVNFENSIEKLKMEIELNKNKINDLKENKKTIEEDLNKTNKTYIKLNSDITIFENDLLKLNDSNSNDQNLLKKIKDDEIDMMNKLSGIKNSKILLNNNIENLDIKLNQLSNSCDGFLNSLNINLNTKKRLQNEVLRIEDNIKAYENNIKANKNEINKLNSILSKKDNELRECILLHNKLDANKQMLINLEKQFEGYNKSSKILLQDISKGKIIIKKDTCFILGDIISLEKNYEIAIEIALGGSISDLITIDEIIAKKLINYLKENNIGRATFLPLTIIKNKKIIVSEFIRQIDGYIGIASDLISFDSKFKNAIEYVLGRIIIARDMDCALEIAKKSNYGYKIVTLSGEVINSGGSLTGGSIFHKNSNIIGRKREIDDLSHKINELNEQISSYTEKIESDKSTLKRLDDLQLNYKDEIYAQNIEITKLHGKITSIESENEKIKKSIEIANIEIANTKVKKENYEQDILTKSQEYDAIKDKEEENVKNISLLEDKLNKLTKDIFSNRDILTNLKIDKAKINESILNKTNELERVSNEIFELEKKYNNYTNELKINTDNKENSSLKIKNISERIEELKKYFEKQDIIFKQNEIERISLKEKIKIYNDKTNDVTLLLSRKEDEMHKQEINLAKLTTEKDGLYTKLNDEFQLTYAEALNFKMQIHNIDILKNEIINLKAKISSLGVINLGAIEEYEDIKEKFTFMNVQKDDLLKAKDELTSVINDMTNKMKVMFKENFIKLRQNFNETFQELFKGGSADLILADGDELQANIEINVEPPGKKLQNINLLSGGEKGLSAIALLFAILKMKPTPFCILDEIEAALDDANVLRYAEFLKKFSDKIQFIVITHRKGTMEYSDILYGITMEEKGISKVVSVDLCELK